MTLDVAVPDSPDLSNQGTPSGFELDEETLGEEDFHREELEELLLEGAWQEGFTEWAEYTELDQGEVRIVSELGLFQALDFYWDPVDSVLRFDPPTIPDDWRTRDVSESLDSATVSMIDAELQDLGRAVQETLEAYLESAEERADDWEKMFGHGGA
jgi:hypothetical protein